MRFEIFVLDVALSLHTTDPVHYIINTVESRLVTVVVRGVSWYSFCKYFFSFLLPWSMIVQGGYLKTVRFDQSERLLDLLFSPLTLSVNMFLTVKILTIFLSLSFDEIGICVWSFSSFRYSVAQIHNRKNVSCLEFCFVLSHSFTRTNKSMIAWGRLYLSFFVSYSVLSLEWILCKKKKKNYSDAVMCTSNPLCHRLRLCAAVVVVVVVVVVNFVSFISMKNPLALSLSQA